MKKFERILLLSSSPRRREILKMVGIPFRVFSNVSAKEVVLKTPEETAVKNALTKLKEGLKEKKENEIALAADTTVFIDDRILGKPKNRDEAVEFLTLLSGNVHQVVTGFALALDGCKIISGFDTTNVKFKKLSSDEIEWYINTGEPFDKAGAYGIQGKGAFFVERIDGDFFNVMGLPIAKIYDILLKNGIDLKNLGG